MNFGIEYKKANTFCDRELYSIDSIAYIDERDLYQLFLMGYVEMADAITACEHEYEIDEGLMDCTTKLTDILSGERCQAVEVGAMTALRMYKGEN